MLVSHHPFEACFLQDLLQECLNECAQAYTKCLMPNKDEVGLAGIHYAEACVSVGTLQANGSQVEGREAEEVYWQPTGSG